MQDSVCSVQGSGLNRQSAPEGGFGRLAACVLDLLLSDSNGPLLGETVHCNVQQCAVVYSFVQECTAVYSSVLQCTSLYNSVKQ